MELIPGLPNDMALECLVRIPFDHFSTAAFVCKAWKFEFQLPEFWRHRKAAGFARTLLVMAQARFSPAHNSLASKVSFMPVYRLMLFEPETGYWSELPPPPAFSEGLPWFCQLVGVGKELVVMGGYNPETWEASKSVFVYNFLSAKWRCGAAMPGGARIFFGCASDSDRRVFVAGGHDGEKNALKSAVAYDVAEDKWTFLPDMATERDECKGVFQRGKFHVIGGYRTVMQGRFARSAESFEIATWQWDQVQEGFLEVAACPRTCTGGVEAARSLYMCREGELVQWRKDTNWQVIGGLPTDVVNGPYLTTWHGKLLVIGSDKFGGPHKAYAMDLRNHNWSKLEMPQEYPGNVLSGCSLEI